jgi:hypothetical protein
MTLGSRGERPHLSTVCSWSLNITVAQVVNPTVEMDKLKRFKTFCCFVLVVLRFELRVLKLTRQEFLYFSYASQP